MSTVMTKPVAAMITEADYLEFAEQVLPGEARVETVEDASQFIALHCIQESGGELVQLLNDPLKIRSDLSIDEPVDILVLPPRDVVSH